MSVPPSMFAMDLRQSLTPSHHIGVNSGSTVVQPKMPTVCGVGPFFSPPIVAKDFTLQLVFVVNGHQIVDDGNYGKNDCGLLYSGGTWNLDNLTRTGTYHYLVNGKILSLASRSELYPIFGRAGFIETVTLRNRTNEPMRVELQPQVRAGSPGNVPLSKWDYSNPNSLAGEAVADGDLTWRNGQVRLRLLHEGLSGEILPGEEREFVLAVICDAAGEGMDQPHELREWRRQTKEAWARRLAAVGTRLPVLETDISGLQAYYNRALVSGLVCIWENPNFVTNPFLATSGMDGGAICCYPWDTCNYAPHGFALLLGEKIKDILATVTREGLLANHSRLAPDGTPASCAYSYNMVSMLTLVRAAACHFGPDLAVFTAVRDTLLAIDGQFSKRGELVDFGFQHNLLEMRQTGWEHFTPSPNAERAWCFEQLANLADALGQPGGVEWRAKAERIRVAVQQELWDEKVGWFKCLFPDGHAEYCYSIQAFDALRAGACTPKMAEALLGHIRDGAFLGNYGVSSVSAEDHVHYELNDPDWSGGGSYTGEGPALALTLWELGHDELAFDVLRRHFWMGQHLLYYPQEHYCDRPAVAGHKRANIVSGLIGVEAVLMGLMGLRPGFDGALAWRPARISAGKAVLKGLMFRGHSIELAISPAVAEARVDGKRVPSTPGTITQLLPSRG